MVQAYIIKHSYRIGGMLFTICKAQQHISATNFGHLQVVQIKLINQLYMHLQGVCRVQGGRYKCEISRVWGVGPWIQVDQEPYIDTALCLLRTMSRISYIIIYLDGKMQQYMIFYGLSLQSKYTVMYCTLWTPGSIVHCLFCKISTKALK